MNKKADVSIKDSSLLRNLLSTSISFIQCLLVALLAACVVVCFALTPKFAVKNIKSSNYSSFALAEMTEDLNDLSIPAGLPSDFFDEKLNDAELNEFENLLTLKLTSVIKGKQFKVDVDAIKSKFQGYVDEYASEHFGLADTVSSKAVTQFINECTTTYLEYLNPTVFQFLFNNFAKLGKIVVIAAIALSIIVLAVFILLFKLCSNKNFCKYMFLTLSSGGLILGAVPSYLLLTDELSKIGITQKSLHSFIYRFSSDLLTMLVIAAGILVFLSLIFLVLEIKGSAAKNSAVQTTKNT